MAPSMGISYVTMILSRLVWGKCLKVSQGVILKMVMGNPLGDPFSKKEGRRGTKIRSMNRRKTSLALEKGCFKRTEHCQVLQGIGILIRGMRSWNACVG